MEVLGTFLDQLKPTPQIFKWLDAKIGVLKAKDIERTDLEKQFKMHFDIIEKMRVDARTMGSHVDALLDDTKKRLDNMDSKVTAVKLTQSWGMPTPNGVTTLPGIVFGAANHATLYGQVGRIVNK